MTADNLSTPTVGGVTETLRKFSQDSRESLHAVRSQLADNNAVGEQLQGVLSQIWSEAAFLGCPTIARLSRSLMPAAGSVVTERNDDMVGAVLEALETLEGLLGDPACQELIEVSEQRTTALNELADPADSAKRASYFRKASQIVRPEGDVCVGAESNHSDVNLYSNEAIDGLEWCTREETWIVSQLAATAEDLAKSTSEVRPAHQLMRIFAGHQYFSEVDRVCIVGLMPHSNQLVVVDSCLHPRMREQSIRNRMVRGYSCLVNPGGSLAQMRPGVLRVFADSQSVLESFAREGKPAQRSIAYVGESGLRSGICLAIGRGESVQGYLFMNSRRPDMFRDVKRDFGPLLSLFSLLGTVALDGAGFHGAVRSQAEHGEGVPTRSEMFSKEVFERHLQATMQRFSPLEFTPNVVVKTNVEFLYVPALVLQTFCDMMLRLGFVSIDEPSAPTIEVDLQNERIEFRVMISEEDSRPIPKRWRQERIEELSGRLNNRPIQLQLSEDSARLSIPFEPAFSGNGRIRYSTAY